MMPGMPGAQQVAQMRQAVMYTVCRDDAGDARCPAGGSDEAGSAGRNATAGSRSVDDVSSNHRTAAGCCATTTCRSVELLCHHPRQL